MPYALFVCVMFDLVWYVGASRTVLNVFCQIFCYVGVLGTVVKVLDCCSR